MTSIDKFSVKVNLVVIAREGNRFLLDGSTFPSDYLVYGLTTAIIAETLLNVYTGLNSHWAKLFPIGLVEKDNETTLNMLYSAFIPEPTNIRIPSSRWLTYKEIEDFDPLTLELAKASVYRPI